MTDEFRQVYPPEEQNCWTAGCHGKRTYANGFTLPPTVPRLIGSGALNKFSSAASLHAFISQAMPFQAPGTLNDKLYWELTAFLLRENGIWNGQSAISDSNAGQILIQPPASIPSAVTPQVPEKGSGDTILLISVSVGLMVLILIVFLVLRKKTRI